MPLLFSYGSLQRAEVQRQLFGRVVSSQPDQLVGYDCLAQEVSDPAFVASSGSSHLIVRFNGKDASRVDGIALELTEQEIMVTDQYEPEPYRRVETRLASGRMAWVYADTGAVGA